MTTNHGETQLKSSSLLELNFISGINIAADGTKAVAVHSRIHQPAAQMPTDTATNTEPETEPCDSDTADQTGPKDADAPKYHNDLYLYHLDTEQGLDRAPIQLTGCATTNRAAQFNPAGTHIAFLSNRTHRQTRPEDAKEVLQLNLMSLCGGEAQTITKFGRGVSNYVWSPDGTKIACITFGDVEEPDAGQPKVIDKFTYKWDQAGFTPTAKQKLYLIDVGTGTAQFVHQFDFAPSNLIFGNTSDVLYYAAPSTIAQENTWHGNIFRIELDNRLDTDSVDAAANPATRSAADTDSTVKPVAVLKDEQRLSSFILDGSGDNIYLFSNADVDNFSTATTLWKVPLSTGVAQRLTDKETDLAPLVGGDSKYGAYRTSPKLVTDTDGSEHIIVCVNRSGVSTLAKVDLDTGTISTIITGTINATSKAGQRYVVTSFDTSANGRTIATIETPTTPGELFVVESDGSHSQLSSVNADFVSRYELAEPSEPRTVRAAKSESDVEYWVMSPAKARADNAVVIQVHGGPHTNYGYGFNFEFQLLAARGYSVVYGNPRGSSSYGNDFVTALLGRYGTCDADDVMAITEDAMNQHVDPAAPVHLTGGSYGGFMTNWLIGATTRFRSAVTQRSICNWLSMFGTSDIGPTFTEHQIGGNPWDNTELLWKQSPLSNVANVETPTLIIHSEADYRCPVEQAEQWFTALQYRGVETRLIRYPNECHELSRSGRPDRRIHRLDAIIDWFETHA